MFDLQDFRSRVEQLHTMLEQTDEGMVTIQLSEDAWSLKEILGHLIDSAANNHQRFIRLQQGNLEGYPAYDGERWIKIQRYNDAEWCLLTDLWLKYNQLLLWVIECLPEDCSTNSWSLERETHTLEWLVNDYYRHLSWHTEHYQKRMAEINAR